MKQNLIVKFKKLNSEAHLPTQSPGDVGWDLFAIKDITLYTGTMVKVKTGLALAESPSAEGGQLFAKIEGRSGLASKGIWPVGGILDQSYRGEIIVLLYNATCSVKHQIKKGDRIAQLVFYRAECSDTGMVLEEVEELEETERGSGGLGSSGA